MEAILKYIQGWELYAVFSVFVVVCGVGYLLSCNKKK